MINHRRIFKIVGYALLGILVVFSLLSYKKNPAEIQYGATFSKYRSDELGLDWKKVYVAALDELGIRYFRLVAHWPMIEPRRGEFDFSDFDYQIKEAEKHGAKAIVAVGRRLPSWPECHEPDWANGLAKHEKEAEIIEYITEVVIRYKDSAAVEYWQVENEPFLSVFAKEHCGELDENFLASEIELVKKLDPTRKILVTDSGNLGLWYGAWRAGDMFGTSVYMYLWNPNIGQVKSVYLPSFYKIKSNLMGILFGFKENILVELSLEPWLLEPIKDASTEIQLERMNLQKIDEIIEFASKTGFEKQYLWGVEWWYFMRERGHDEFWERGEKLFSR
jgi:hypothetical protein